MKIQKYDEFVNEELNRDLKLPKITSSVMAKVLDGIDFRTWYKSDVLVIPKNFTGESDSDYAKSLINAGLEPSLIEHLDEVRFRHIIWLLKSIGSRIPGKSPFPKWSYQGDLVCNERALIRQSEFVSKLSSSDLKRSVWGAATDQDFLMAMSKLISVNSLTVINSAYKEPVSLESLSDCLVLNISGDVQLPSKLKTLNSLLIENNNVIRTISGLTFVEKQGSNKYSSIYIKDCVNLDSVIIDSIDFFTIVDQKDCPNLKEIRIKRVNYDLCVPIEISLSELEFVGRDLVVYDSYGKSNKPFLKEILKKEHNVQGLVDIR